MNEYVNAYMESKLEAQEYNCERVRENCYCEDANDDQVSLRVLHFSVLSIVYLSTELQPLDSTL